MRRAILVVLLFVLAGCGGGSSGPKPLYESGDWRVVVDGGKATAEHKEGRSWVADTSGAVKISILGPHATAPTTPQVAAELSARSALVESALWVDGTELLEKGGGLTPTRGTIYGAPAAPLTKGTHVAVAYGRTATHANAVAWTFRVV